MSLFSISCPHGTRKAVQKGTYLPLTVCLVLREILATNQELWRVHFICVNKDTFQSGQLSLKNLIFAPQYVMSGGLALFLDLPVLPHA